jgi:glycerol uptake facilitator-like aquaporin
MDSYFPYIAEFMGTLVIVYTFLLTDMNPAIIGIVYFAAYTIAGDMAMGTFNPLGALAFYALGRLTLHETVSHIFAQVMAMEFAVISFMPLKTFIGDV